jgi:hypothetical protein
VKLERLWLVHTARKAEERHAAKKKIRPGKRKDRLVGFIEMQTNKQTDRFSNRNIDRQEVERL